MFGSEEIESERPGVIDFSGATIRVDESESRRADSERSGLGTIEVDGLAGSDFPGVTTGMGKTTPPEVVMAG